MSAGTPSGFFTPSSGSQLTATVALPKLTLNPVSLGTNLQVQASGGVESGAPAGGLSVTVTSSNSSVVALSTDPSLQGSGSITLNVPAGQPFLPSFYVQALGASGSTAQLTATATNFQSSTANVSITPAGFVIAVPRVLSVRRSLPVRLSLPSDVHSSGHAVERIAGSTGNWAASWRYLGQRAGHQRYPIGRNHRWESSYGSRGGSANNNSVTFNPLSQGSSVLSLGTPSVSGFNTPTSGASLTATVTQPQITLGLASTIIGKDLQVPGSGTLSAAAPSGGLQITIRVTSGSGILLSTSPTGSRQHQRYAYGPEGSTGGGSFPAYYVQATASSGTATITAEATGWISTPVTVTLKPSGFVLRGPNGIGQDFGTYRPAAISALSVESWQINDGTLVPEHPQAIRGGLSFSVDVTSSNTSVGTILGSPVTVNGTSTTFAVTFHPHR